MMTAGLSAARARAVLHLQHIRARRAPDSFGWLVADHAIDLALSPRRPEGPFLVSDCLINAASVVALSHRRSGRLFNFEIDDDVLGVEDERLGAFDALVWAESYAIFRTEVAILHRHGMRVLDGLEAGEEVEDTAKATSLSPRQVKTLRSRIRALAGVALIRGRA
jgi:hypothetical protein